MPQDYGLVTVWLNAPLPRDRWHESVLPTGSTMHAATACFAPARSAAWTPSTIGAPTGGGSASTAWLSKPLMGAVRHHQGCSRGDGLQVSIVKGWIALVAHALGRVNVVGKSVAGLSESVHLIVQSLQP